MECSYSRKERIFTFYWKIKNLRYGRFLTNECINSPSFTLPVLGGSTWHLLLYIEDDCPPTTTDSITCSLCNDSCNGDTKSIKVNTNISVSVINENFECEVSLEPNCEEDILEDCEIQRCDSFIICCEIRYLEADCLDSKTKNVKHLPLSFLLENASKLLSPTSQELNVPINLRQSEINKLIQYPAKCFAQTVFFPEKNVISVPLDIFLTAGSKIKHIIPVTLSTDLPPLIITIGNDDETDTNLSVKIRMAKEKKIDFLSVFYQISVLVNGKTVIQLPLEQHLVWGVRNQEFTTVEETLQTSNFISKLEDPLTNLVTLKFEFVRFDDGENRSEILWEETVDRGDSVLPYTHATRAILAAMSDPEMADNETSTVNIVDLNEDAVREFLTSINRGALQNFEFETAQKLYLAADKYKLLLLRNLCGECLLSNISFWNVCEILSIADRHADFKLKEAAIKFICFCERLILDSDQWKQLKKANLALACEVLEKACLER